MKLCLLCEIWGSDGGENVDVGLLGPYAVWSNWYEMAAVSPERWYLPTNPHDVTIQNTNIDVWKGVGRSNFGV